MEPGRVFLEGYYCRKCGEEIELIDNFWQCGCYKIGAYELDCGYHEKPEFWVEYEVIKDELSSGPTILLNNPDFEVIKREDNKNEQF